MIDSVSGMLGESGMGIGGECNAVVISLAAKIEKAAGVI